MTLGRRDDFCSAASVSDSKDNENKGKGRSMNFIHQANSLLVPRIGQLYTDELQAWRAVKHLLVRHCTWCACEYS